MDNLIFTYTREEAIEDGVLMTLERFLQDKKVSLLMLEAINAVNRQCGKFALGELIITTHAANVVSVADVVAGLIRHQIGDWSELCDDDQAENRQALLSEQRIFSTYSAGETKIWIITEWNREATTVMLPDDY